MPGAHFHADHGPCGSAYKRFAEQNLGGGRIHFARASKIYGAPGGREPGGDGMTVAVAVSESLK